MKVWELWIKVRYWGWWPWNIYDRLRQARLTLKRGYSTFVLDEFDYHFNLMAVDSLKWHLSDACPVFVEEVRRTQYEDLIERLSETSPDPTSEESVAIDTWDLFSGEPRYGKNGKVIGYVIPPCPAGARSAMDSWQARENEWERRQIQARHDFVDIMRGLWS